MNRQLLAELQVSSSDSSPDTTHIQDPTDLQDHPEDWLILDQIYRMQMKQNGGLSPPEHYF